MTLQSLIDVIQKIEEWLLATGVLMIAALSIANVASRIVTGDSLASAEELSQFAIILVTFVGLSYAAGRGRHIRMTALYDQLNLKWRKAVTVAVAAATAGLMFLLAWYSRGYIRTVADLGSVSPVLQVPLWLVYLAAPLGFVLAGLQYALAVVRNLTAEDVYLSWQQKDEYEAPLPDGM